MAQPRHVYDQYQNFIKGFDIINRYQEEWDRRARKPYIIYELNNGDEIVSYKYRDYVFKSTKSWLKNIVENGIDINKPLVDWDNYNKIQDDHIPSIVYITEEFYFSENMNDIHIISKDEHVEKYNNYMIKYSDIQDNIISHFKQKSKDLWEKLRDKENEDPEYNYYRSEYYTSNVSHKLDEIKIAFDHNLKTSDEAFERSTRNLLKHYAHMETDIMPYLVV